MINNAIGFIPQMKLVLLLLSISVIFSYSLAVRADQKDYITNESVYKIGKDLAQRLKIDVSINVTDDNDITSDPDSGVKVGMGKIKADINGQPEDLQKEIVAFYIAHELWHQYQFKTHGESNIFKSESDKLLFECEADFVGGYLSMSISIEVFVDYLSHIGRSNLAEFMSHQGEPLHPGATHPTAIQRRTAVMAGIEYSVADIFSHPRISNKFLTPKQAKDLVSGISGRQFKDEPLLGTGSLNFCKTIVNYEPTVINDISTTVKEVHFNKDPKVATVQYSVEYANEGSHTVCLVAAVRCTETDLEHMQNKDPDPMPWNYSIAFYKLKLKPEERKTVTGALKWGEYSLDKRPALLAEKNQPGNLLSAVYCAE